MFPENLLHLVPKPLNYVPLLSLSGATPETVTVC